MYCGHGKHAVRAGGTATHVCATPSHTGGSTAFGKFGNVPTPQGLHTLPVPTHPSGHISQSVLSVPLRSTRVPLGQLSQKPSRPAISGGHASQPVLVAFGCVPSKHRSHAPPTPKCPDAQGTHPERALFGRVLSGHTTQRRPSAEYIPGPSTSQCKHPVAPVAV
jgi:hypothetical protein